MSFFCCGTKKNKRNTSKANASMSADKLSIIPESSQRPISKPPIQSSSLNSSINRKNDNESIQQSTQNTCVIAQCTPDLSQQSSRISSRTSTEDITEKITQLLKMKERGQHQESINEEKIYVTRLIGMSDKEEYMLSTQWAIAYTEYLQKTQSKMELIDNRKLLDDPSTSQDLSILISTTNRSKLRRGMRKEVDYVYLNELAWLFVKTLYGGGPELKHDLKSREETPASSSLKVHTLQTPYKTTDTTNESDSKFRTDDRPPRPNTKPPRHTNTEEVKSNRFQARARLVPIHEHGLSNYQRDMEDKQELNQRNQQEFNQEELSPLKQGGRSISVPQKMEQPSTINQSQTPKLWEMSSAELPIIGLRNQRFFCYMNSALQCLTSIPQLNSFFLSGQSKVIQGTKRRKYTPVYEEFVESVMSKSKGNIPVFDATGIQKLTDSLFSYYEQHDSHEFLLHMLSEIQEEVHVKSKFPECKTSIEAHNVYFASHNNPIDQVFAGLITSSVHCPKCKQCTQQFDPIFDLSVPMKSNMMSEPSIYDCLKLYFKEEEIDDIWKCDLCKKSSKPVKRSLKMSYSPNILIIHMKRFTAFPRKEKIKSDLSYPEELDIKSFCAPECLDVKYRLKAVIVHSGSINGGHYFAFTKRKQTWYCFNDDMVEKVTEAEVLKQKQAYVLFYEKVLR